MRILKVLIVGTIVAVSMLGSIAAVAAKDGDVIARGDCSGRSDWKLKLSPEDGAIEVSFEVDQNRNGQTWNVAISDNGTSVFSGTAVTRAPSGSFDVHLVIANQAGSDMVMATASNQLTGETCTGSATATF